MMGEITWNRQVSRIVYAHCVSCHRENGTAFSLVEYAEARPVADAIKRAVLSRRMPPWGAVKGFGEFREDGGLSESQIETIVDWVETGTARGNNPRALPELPPAPQPITPFAPPPDAVVVNGNLVLDRPLEVAGLYVRTIGTTASFPIVAVLPGGDITPLLWLYEYRNEYAHPFWLRNALVLPSGTEIRGVPIGAELLLLPAP